MANIKKERRVKRTQIMLYEDQSIKLDLIAKKNNSSISQLIREAVDDKYPLKTK